MCSDFLEGVDQKSSEHNTEMLIKTEVQVSSFEYQKR